MEPVERLVATCMIYLTSIEEDEEIKSEEDIAQIEEFWRALATGNGDKLQLKGFREKFSKLKNIIVDSDKIVGVKDEEMAKKLKVALKSAILLRAENLKGMKSGREKLAFLKKREEVKKKLAEIRIAKEYLARLQIDLQELRKA